MSLGLQSPRRVTRALPMRPDEPAKRIFNRLFPAPIEGHVPVEKKGNFTSK